MNVAFATTVEEYAGTLANHSVETSKFGGFELPNFLVHPSAAVDVSFGFYSCS